LAGHGCRCHRRRGLMMLALSGVSAGYGPVMAITGVSITVGEGETVGLLGANGAGKSTILRAISGLVSLRSGIITFEGANIASLPAYKIVEHGIAHVPEGRRVFPEMTVQENLEIGSYVPRAKADRRRTLELVFTIFPRLAQRRSQVSGTMSGGEQQMLAIGRGLMLKPRLLMLDEPSLGLAPVVIDSTFDAIQKIHSLGMAILLVEQNASRALTLVRRAYVLERGEVVMHGTSAELADNDRMREAYLGIGAVSDASD
jgi:branched-chain amino acid transport system ATP-binding protein